MTNKIGFVIVTYNSEKYIDHCLKSIKNQHNFDINIVVVDNNSHDNTVNLVESHEGVAIIRNSENFGYAKAVNQGLRNLEEEFVFIINPDIEFSNKSIEIMHKKISKNKNIGVLGGQQVFPSGGWQRSYGQQIGLKDSFFNLFFITTFINFLNKAIFKYNKDFLFTKNVGYVDGGAIVVRKSAFDDVLGFDESFFFYCEETDFCLKLKKAGWKVIYYPKAIVMHVRGGSSTKIDNKKYYFLDLLISSKKIFFKKNKSILIFQLCKYLEFLHNLKMAIIYKCLSVFFINDKSYIDKYTFFKVAARTWIK